jgi:hypothetical protein
VSALALDELQAELSRYTYRPGWALTVEPDPYEGNRLWIVADVADAYHPDATVQLRIDTFVPPMPNAEAFGRWLLWRLLRVESHECREWLRYDGLPLADPHQQPSRPATEGAAK